MIQNKMVLPGDKLSTSEELLLGEGTFEEDGIIRAARVGKYVVDEKHRRATVKPATSIPVVLKKGDIVVGGENFGCGSSREQAPISIKEAGAGAIVAKSFARIFFRNAINAGLLVITCREAVDGVKKGDEIAIDLENAKILSGQKSYHYPPLAGEVADILKCGGLVAYTKKKILGK